MCSISQVSAVSLLQLLLLSYTEEDYTVSKVSELEIEGTMEWLQVEGDIMYAIDTDSNLVSRWRLEKDYSRLERLQMVEMPGDGPANLVVDRRMVRYFIDDGLVGWLDMSRVWCSVLTTGVAAGV